MAITLLLQASTPDVEIVNSFLDYIRQLGWSKGIAAFLVLLLHFWIFYLYDRNIKDKQNQIDKIAKENREYRERFLSIMDKQFKYTPKKPK